ncbi:type II secretion system minor pseudopilin GspI [Psychrobacter sp. I-STPA6b]|uniref:type II secretion system minor pseudopilin GspI n=1 Tax=Psychrobacter sp. I-STPA6b TaxID=2585718 RepID=UPI001D0C7F00|nr:type II secretion system minor pseudopilin GspI [Psychrobacter sp. I-STPA6b]
MAISHQAVNQNREQVKLVPAQQGFTLIEVMVALAILAGVAIAASQASGTYLRSVDHLKTQTLANFVAQNTVADLRIQKKWLTSEQTQQVSSQGREWQVIITPTPLEGVDDSLKVNQVFVQVAPIVDGQVKNTVTDVTAVIKQPQDD